MRKRGRGHGRPRPRLVCHRGAARWRCAARHACATLARLIRSQKARVRRRLANGLVRRRSADVSRRRWVEPARHRGDAAHAATWRRLGCGSDHGRRARRRHGEQPSCARRGVRPVSAWCTATARRREPAGRAWPRPQRTWTVPHAWPHVAPRRCGEVARGSYDETPPLSSAARGRRVGRLVGRDRGGVNSSVGRRAEAARAPRIQRTPQRRMRTAVEGWSGTTY